MDTLEYLTELVADKDTTIRHLRQLLLPASTEKTKDLLAQVGVPSSSGRAERKPAGSPEQPQADPPPGHGRNGAEAFTGARPVQISHPKLKHGDRCPQCGQGNVYGQKDPKVLVRIVGQAPLAATVYRLERLRCGACGLIFTAQEPEGVGPEKFDETAAAMIAQLKYGSGTPFYRLEQLERHLGIPLPTATQWEIVEEAAEVIKPARASWFGRRRRAMLCTTTTPACGYCVWCATLLTNAPGCLLAALWQLGKGARSRCTSPDRSMRARIWPTR